MPPCRSPQGTSSARSSTGSGRSRSRSPDGDGCWANGTFGRLVRAKVPFTHRSECRGCLSGPLLLGGELDRHVDDHVLLATHVAQLATPAQDVVRGHLVTLPCPF